MTDNTPVYLPGLNGIRAIAALAVVISHVTLGLGGFGLDPRLFGTFADGTPRGADLAAYGVSVFFVLSGFLITVLLLKEKAKGAVDVRRFYIRRILRIWPLYYLYFLVAVLVASTLGLGGAPGMAKYYVLLAANVPFVLGTVMPLLAHYWSLGVEEQFYVVWPWALRLKTEHLLMLALTAAVALIGAKAVLHMFLPGSLAESAIHVTRVHCMLFGAVAAIWYHGGNRRFLDFATHPVTQAVAVGVFLLVALNRFHIASFLDQEIVSVFAVFIIVGQGTAKSFFSLEKPVFDFLGRISYGMYVVHPLMLLVWARALGGVSLPSSALHVVAYGSVILSTVGVAHLSYRYFEKGFLRLKRDRFSVVASASTALDAA